MKKESNPIIRFMSNPYSRVAAIRAKCAECVGCTPEHLENGFKESISACTSHQCPLYTFRPFQRKERPKSAISGVQ